MTRMELCFCVDYADYVASMVASMACLVPLWSGLCVDLCMLPYRLFLEKARHRERDTTYSGP
jgi:hypothetical protein